MRVWLGGVAVLLAMLAPLAAVAAESPSAAELIAIGQRLYRDGTLADGSPIQALVMGDVEVSGEQFACLNCHRRSGLGGAEGVQLVLPVNGPSLLTPRVNLRLERPAYDAESFAVALRQGINPLGTPFDPVMPRYRLPELEAKALFSYLKSLSSTFSPGVDADNLHLATVVSADVDPAKRQQVLAVLDAYFKNKNAETRNERKRLEAGVFFQAYRTKAYRHWVHHVWELTGPPESWAKQLAAYERQQPVFALVSGLVSGPWTPVHEFCRRQQIPCILPNTDLPELDAADSYTLYYSRGLALEAEVLADALHQAGYGRVLQVVRAGTEGAAGGERLQALLQAQGVVMTQSPLPQSAAGWREFGQQLNDVQPDALVLWLDAPDLQTFAAEVAGIAPVYLSSSLLDGNLEAVPPPLRKGAKAVHPFLLPEEQGKRFVQTAAWLKNNQIPLVNPRLQGQTFYACLLLTGSLTHIRQHFYRDYLLDKLEHRDNMSIYSGNYPRLSFGPEQHFLAKGAYIINLTDGSSRWVVPGM